MYNKLSYTDNHVQYDNRFCDKLEHTESECRMPKSAIADLKTEIAQKSVGCTTSTPAEEEEEELTFEAVYAHSTKTVSTIHITTLCARTSYFVTTQHLLQNSKTKTDSPTQDHLELSVSLVQEAVQTSLNKAILETLVQSRMTKELLSTCYLYSHCQHHRSSHTTTMKDATPSQSKTRTITLRFLPVRKDYQCEDSLTSIQIY